MDPEDYFKTPRLKELLIKFKQETFRLKNIEKIIKRKYDNGNTTKTFSSLYNEAEQINRLKLQGKDYSYYEHISIQLADVLGKMDLIQNEIIANGIPMLVLFKIRRRVFNGDVSDNEYYIKENEYEDEEEEVVPVNEKERRFLEGIRDEDEDEDEDEDL